MPRRIPNNTRSPEELEGELIEVYENQNAIIRQRDSAVMELKIWRGLSALLCAMLIASGVWHHFLA